MEIKANNQDGSPFQGKGSGLSTGNVQIMPAMQMSGLSCASENTRPLGAHEKPGYYLCRYVDHFIDTGAGPVPVIRREPDRGDRLSTIAVRCGIRRHRYMVSPGLYGIGTPDASSEVLVTANFKLTFDHLRSSLGRVSAWILVLDTRGVNVWCAAGKKTFSTRELVNRIQAASLEKVVAHKRVIVPQLGATGVSARQVKKLSGFRVVYGPVRACDIPAFLTSGRKADKAMRQVTFPLFERFVLTPVELHGALKMAGVTALVLFVLSGIGPGIFSFHGAWERGLKSLAALVTGLISGAVLTPVLLPYIPSKKFAFKGIVMGGLCALLLVSMIFKSVGGMTGAAALFIFSVMVSSHLAMNFTGATPFTSPSGVEKEMKQYLPIQLAGVLVSAGLWVYSAF
ncbi:MAG: mercury methylation corrinoid protein HgcA [Desulfotignum sp.]|nr:mercury methylation corrinoid protein HgcA [Desulfotignum sp.]